MDLALKADFLDLTLEIKNGHIVTKTYEKPTNLFLYILQLLPILLECSKALFLEMSIVIGIKIPILMITDI